MALAGLAALAPCIPSLDASHEPGSAQELPCCEERNSTGWLCLLRLSLLLFSKHLHWPPVLATFSCMALVIASLNGFPQGPCLRVRWSSHDQVAASIPHSSFHFIWKVSATAVKPKPRRSSVQVMGDRGARGTACQCFTTFHTSRPVQVTVSHASDFSLVVIFKSTWPVAPSQLVCPGLYHWAALGLLEPFAFSLVPVQAAAYSLTSRPCLPTELLYQQGREAMGTQAGRTRSPASSLCSLPSGTKSTSILRRAKENRQNSGLRRCAPPPAHPRGGPARPSIHSIYSLCFPPRHHTARAFP